jgi:predicted nucleotidyltransferase component of viral defense system
MENSWFSGSCELTTYALEELLGTKLRALYQRKKGRDLFDLYKALNVTDADSETIIRCYRRYMDFAVSPVSDPQVVHPEYGRKIFHTYPVKVYSPFDILPVIKSSYPLGFIVFFVL